MILTPVGAAAKGKKKPLPRLGPVSTVAASGNIADGTQPDSSATATCPAGTIAVGGGFSAPFSSSNSVVVYESYRSGSTGWTASARRTSGAGAVTAYANCRRAPRRTVSAATSNVSLSAAFENGTVDAQCPVGTSLIAGGFRSTVGTGTDFVLVESNLAFGGGWRVSGVNIQSSLRTLTSEAYCMTKVKPVVILEATTTGAASQSIPILAGSPACPRSSSKLAVNAKKKKKKKKSTLRLSAGGYATPPGASGQPTPFATESRIEAGIWRVSALSATNNAGSVPVTSQAICF